MGSSYAGILGPLAFVTVLLRGVVHGSSADSVLVSALVALVIFAVIGYALGIMADRAVLESVRQRFDHELNQQRTEKSAPGLK